MLYDWPTWLIVFAILILMSAAIELGFRLGRRNFLKETEMSRSVSNALKGSVFALVALLLGFSFSATTSRYDTRQKVLLDQANAIGTAYLRAGLLEDAPRTRIREILRKYVKVSLGEQNAKNDHAKEREDQAEVDRLLAELWPVVEEASHKNQEAVFKSLIVPAINDVLDLSSTWSWANRNHLPDAVLVLLIVSVTVSSLLIGDSSGQAGVRHLMLWIATNLVFALVLYVVLDFDRPRRGLIRVDQTPLVELDASISGPRAK